MDLDDIGCQQRIEEIGRIVNFFKEKNTWGFLYNPQNRIFSRVDMHINFEMLSLVFDLYRCTLALDYADSNQNFYLQQLSNSIEQRLNKNFRYMQQLWQFQEYNMLVKKNIPNNNIYAYDSLFKNLPMQPLLICLPEWSEKFFCNLYANVKQRSNNVDLTNSDIYKLVLGFPHLGNTFFKKMDQDIEPFKEQFDHCFEYTNTVKVLCIDLAYTSNMLPLNESSKPLQKNVIDTSFERCNKHLSIFRQELLKYKKLLTHFDKLEFGKGIDFYVFGVFIFKHNKCDTMDGLHQEIRQLWMKAFDQMEDHYKSLTFDQHAVKPISFLHHNHIKGGMESGVIAKNKSKYNAFVRTTLNYLANQDKIFTVVPDCTFNSTGKLGFRVDPEHHSKLKIKAAPTSKRKPRSSIAYLSDQKQPQSEVNLEQFHLTKPVKKHIAEITRMYNRFSLESRSNCNNEREKIEDTEAIHLLKNMEIFVYLTLEWKLGFFKFEMGSNKLVPTDLGQIYFKLFRSLMLPQLYQKLSGLIRRYGAIFSVGIMLAMLVLKKLYERHNNGQSTYYPNEQNDDFIHLLRKNAEITLLDFRNGKMGNDLFKDTPVNEQIYSLTEIDRFEQLYAFEHNKIKNQTLKLWIDQQAIASKRSLRRFEDYWHDNKAYEGRNIFVMFELKSGNFIKNFENIDGLVSQAIDLLQKMEKPEIYAYLGHWHITCQQTNIKSSRIHLLFSIDGHYVSVVDDFIDLFQAKLKIAVDTYNSSMDDENDKVYCARKHSSFDDWNIETIPIQPTEVNSKQIKSWLFYISHYQQFFMTVPIQVKKKVIKGHLPQKRNPRI